MLKKISAKALFITIALIYSALGFADIQSEFGLTISKSTVNQFLKDVSGEFTIEKQEVNLGTGGILEDLEYSSAYISLETNMNFKLEEKNLVTAGVDFKKFSLELKDFYYEDVQIIRRSGVSARVTTRIRCSNLYIELQDWEGQMSSPVKFENDQLILNTAGGDFRLSGSEISIDLANCSAPRGVDTVFKDLIREWLASEDGKKLLFEKALEYGQTFVDDNLKLVKDLLSIKILEKEITTDFKDVNFKEGRLEVLGLLTVKTENQDYLLSLNQKDFLSVEEEDGIILPESFFSKAVPDAVAEVSVAFKILRKNISGIDRLFKSRFLQFLVWRDLLNFKTKSNFKLDVNLRSNKIDLKQIENGGIRYGVSSLHSIDMDFLNSHGVAMPYMNFNGQARATIGLSSGKNGISIKATKPKLKARASFSPLMSTWRKSRKKSKPWMRILAPQVEKAFDGISFDFSWEDLGLEDYVRDLKIKNKNESIFLEVFLK